MQSSGRVLIYHEQDPEGRSSNHKSIKISVSVSGDLRPRWKCSYHLLEALKTQVNSTEGSLHLSHVPLPCLPLICIFFILISRGHEHETDFSKSESIYVSLDVGIALVSCELAARLRCENGLGNPLFMSTVRVIVPQVSPLTLYHPGTKVIWKTLKKENGDTNPFTFSCCIRPLTELSRDQPDWKQTKQIYYLHLKETHWAPSIPCSVWNPTFPLHSVN